MAAAEGIDAGFHKGGELIVALARTTSRQSRAPCASTSASDSASATACSTRPAWRTRSGSRARSPVSRRGAAAIVHPGRLARGLAALVERMGARIVERTPVTDFRAAGGRGRPDGGAAAGGERGGRRPGRAHHAPRRDPGAGDRPGRRGVPRAPPKLHRQLVPLYSLIVLTEPIDDARWAEIGWAGREVVASARLSIDYLSRTADGRILFGGRGAPYRLRVTHTRRLRPPRRHPRDAPRVRPHLVPDARRRPVHACLGRAAGHAARLAPELRLRPASGIASARGYVGHGVSTANLAGRTLADLIAGEADAPSRTCPWRITAARTGRWSRSAGSASATRRVRCRAWTAARRPRSSAHGPLARGADRQPLRAAGSRITPFAGPATNTPDGRPASATVPAAAMPVSRALRRFRSARPAGHRTAAGAPSITSWSTLIVSASISRTSILSAPPPPSASPPARRPRQASGRSRPRPGRASSSSAGSPTPYPARTSRSRSPPRSP